MNTTDNKVIFAIQSEVRKMVEKELMKMNLSDLLVLTSEIAKRETGFEHLDIWHNDKFFFETMFEDMPYNAAIRALCGEYNLIDKYVRFDTNKDLESLSESEVYRIMKEDACIIAIYLTQNLSYQELDLPIEIVIILDAMEKQINKINGTITVTNEMINVLNRNLDSARYTKEEVKVFETYADLAKYLYRDNMEGLISDIENVGVYDKDLDLLENFFYEDSRVIEDGSHGWIFLIQ